MPDAGSLHTRDRGIATRLLAALLFICPVAGNTAPLLMVSIDGLRPADVIAAKQRGLSIPNLRRFVSEGAYAAGVVGVLPSVTYPSHTTLLTGAAPARHGIVGNTTFDPTAINQGGWYWYAADIKLPTLWEAVSGSGRSTANVHWPVSVGARGINWNLPQIWRTGHADDDKLLEALATPRLVAELEKKLGDYAHGIDESIEGDENRGKFAVELIGAKKPYFITVYLTALDHEQHVEGPGSAKAHAVLERIDAIVGRLIAAHKAAYAEGVIAVVSDHGFESSTTEANLFRLLIDEGLIKLEGDGKIASWEAMPWNSGGSVAIVLARREDAALKARVATLLERVKLDGTLPIAAIADEREIARMGGNPEASFYLNLAPHAVGASFAGADAPLTGPTKIKGMHGYFPAAPALRSTFLLMGRGIPTGRAMGEIDMRAIAPTLARIMAVPLPTAEVAAIELR